MTIDAREWRLWRTGEPLAQRFVVRFADDGETIVGRWETGLEGGTRVTDFDITYRRVR